MAVGARVAAMTYADRLEAATGVALGGSIDIKG